MADRRPQRIQFNRFNGDKLPANAKLITRPGKWGNPFKVGEAIPDTSPLWPYVERLVPGGAGRLTAITILHAEHAVEAYGWWFIEQPALMLTVREELGGRDLACTCRPGAPCHGDFLLGLLDEEDPDA